MIVDMNTSKELFAPNARPKVVYAKFTRESNGSYTMERARVLDEANQYSRSIRQVNKRTVASELQTAAENGQLFVA